MLSRIMGFISRASLVNFQSIQHSSKQRMSNDKMTEWYAPSRSRLITTIHLLISKKKMLGICYDFSNPPRSCREFHTGFCHDVGRMNAEGKTIIKMLQSRNDS